MYGTVARMRIKPGSEQRLLELGRRADMRSIPGLVAEAVLEDRELLAADPEWNDGEIVDTYRRGT